MTLDPLAPPSLALPDRVYVNRNLRLSSVGAIGFDMDHTLALYNPRTFEKLCFELALAWLVERKSYPARIRSLVYRPEQAQRGLVVDKRLGNVLKTDGYGYVSRVRHGLRFLTREERRDVYKRGRLRLTPGRFRVFDTLFDLPEGCLYTELVALKDAEPELVPASYRILFNDIREAIDTIHRDGSLKRTIMADLGRYFLKDPGLGGTLRQFREAGKRLFLLTNSEPDYTAAVMSHLLAGEAAQIEEIFDLIVCTAGKPDFFVPRGRGRAVPRGRNPLLPNRRGNCFTGGDAFFLESKLGAFGDGILYFGDHTFGDILRSKKSVGWRTAMIVPELEAEVRARQECGAELAELEALEGQLEEWVLERDRWLAQGLAGAESAAARTAAIEAGLQRRSVLQRRVAAAFNPHWGPLFKEGRAASRFGAQVKDFACIYTGRVSNLRHYPPDKFFVNPGERLAHEI